MHYNRFRYYDPDAGRFISHDPIGLLGSDNHFQYVPDPVGWVDVLGLARRRKNGQFAKKPGPKLKKVKTKHGNSLDCNLPAEGYTLRDRKTDKLLKYGETTKGEKRYSKKYLRENNAVYQKEVTGTKREMHQWQHQKILEHSANNNGSRPPLNKSDY